MDGYNFAILSDAEIRYHMQRINTLLQSSNTIPEEVAELRRQKQHLRWEFEQRMDDNTEHYRQESVRLAKTSQA